MVWKGKLCVSAGVLLCTCVLLADDGPRLTTQNGSTSAVVIAQQQGGGTDFVPVAIAPEQLELSDSEKLARLDRQSEALQPSAMDARNKMILFLQGPMTQATIAPAGADGRVGGNECDALASVYNNPWDAAAGPGPGNAYSAERRTDASIVRYIVDDVVFASDVTITDLHWWSNEPTSFVHPLGIPTADYIILNADGAGGTPGTLVTEVLGVDLTAGGNSRIDTTDVAFGDPIWFNSIVGLNIPLAAGTYWIGMRMVQDVPSAGQGWWMVGSFPHASSPSDIYYDYGPSTPAWDPGIVAFTVESNMAFCVTGTAGPVPTGACCDDSTGVCSNGVEQTACTGAFQRFAAGATCQDVPNPFNPPCGTVTGACCHLDGTCTDEAPAACAGDYQGDGTTCATTQCPCQVSCPGCGDLDGDGDVDIDDYFIFVDAFATCVGDPKYNPLADFDGDGCIGLADYSAWRQCFLNPTPGLTEPEPCGADSNGGCNSVPEVYTPLNCDDTICATSWANLGSRDTDWYEITVTGTTEISWTVESQFPAAIFILDANDCLNIQLIAQAFASDCVPATATACVPAGTYHLFVAPGDINGGIFDGYPCDQDYVATVSCVPCTIPTGGCCLGDGTCRVLTAAQCATSNGVYNGDGTDCVGAVCTGACCSCVDGSCSDVGIAVCTSGIFGGIGSSCVTTTCPQPPANDSCGTAEALAVGTPGVIAENLCADDDNTPLCGTSSPGHGVWYAVTGTGNTMTATTCSANTDFDTKIQVFCDCGDLVCVGGNDDDAGCLFSGLQSTVTWCSTLGQTYYIHVGGFSTNVGNFELTVTDDGAMCSPAVDCVPPTGRCCYGDPVNCTTNTLGECNALGGAWDDTLDCTTPCPVPVTNDDCVDCTTISVPFAETIDTSTALPGLPVPSCNSTSAVDTDNDIWYCYTPTQDCFLSITVDLMNNYDGIVALYTGADCTTLGEIACADEPDDPALITTNAVAGTNYFIQIGDWGSFEGGGLTSVVVDCSAGVGACCFTDGSCQEETGADCASLMGSYQGDGTSCMPNPCPQPPANDDCAGAVVVTDGTPAAEGDNCFAGLDLVEVSCQSNSNKDVWYEYVATCTGTVTVDTEGSLQSDTVLGVFDACSNGLELACDDDGGTGLLSSLSFQATMGTSYFVRMASYSTGCGDYDLNISCVPAPTGACCSNGICEATTIQVDCNADWFEGQTCPAFVCLTGCTHRIDLHDSFGDGWNGAAVGVFVNGIQVPGSPFTFTSGSFASFTFPANTGDTITTTWTPGSWDSEASYEIYDVNGTQLCGETAPPIGGLTCTGNCAPANDDCANAEALAIGTPGVTADNTEATDDAESQAFCGTSTLNQAMWYTVVGTGNTLTASTCNAGTAFDTKIQVWCNDCTNLICVDGDDDDFACGFSTLQSTVSWCSELGRTYYVAVGGFGTNAGAFELSVTDDATSCGLPPDCVPPTGACCSNGMCIATNEEPQCTALGGTWFLNEDCATFDCGGACCHPDGSCTDEANAGACLDTYQGDGTTCGLVSCPQPATPGDDCTLPIAVSIPADLDYSDANYTCGRLDDYSATCLASYDGGEDIIYELNVTADTCVDISVTTDASWVGLGLDSACPLGGTCLATSTSSSGNQSLGSQNLTVGTYYVMVDTWPSPTCINSLGLSITACPTGACCSNGVCIATTTQANCAGDWFAGEMCPGYTCPGGCAHRIDLSDSFGDGWNGAAVGVFVNAVEVPGSPFTLTSGSFGSFSFTADTGDTITTTWTSGSWDSEASYDIYDGTNTLLCGEAAPPVGGLSCTGNCPPRAVMPEGLEEGTPERIPGLQPASAEQVGIRGNR